MPVSDVLIGKQDLDWKEIFNEYFGNCQSPKWTISIVRNRKEEPKNKKQWKHFFMFRDDALFECETCSQWGSAYGWVSIWYRLNHKMQQGEVVLRIYGQECKRCREKVDNPAQDKNVKAKEEGYTFGKWQENEMDRVMREFHDQIMAEFYNKPAPVPKTTKPPQPVNFSALPAHWNDLFDEMFACFRQINASLCWSLSQVDQDLPRLPKRYGPYRLNTETCGSVFVWFQCTNKTQPNAEAKIMIRFIKKGRIPPEGWEEDQVELLLFAIYQEVAFKCFGLERSDGYPVLTYVKPFFRKPETEEQMFQRAMEAPHKRELCQACRENLCQVGGRGVPYKIVILNSRNRS